MNGSNILPLSAEITAADCKEGNEYAQEFPHYEVRFKEPLLFPEETLKLPIEQFFNTRSSWKTKILFAIKKLPGGSLSEISDYLHHLEPDKSIDEILTYVTWYTIQIQNEIGVTNVNSVNEEFYYWL